MYAMNDKLKTGLMRINEADARRLNKDGYGIFQLVNPAKGLKKEDSVDLKTWYVDVDCKKGQTKKAMLTRLLKGPVKPSRINETKRGFHAFWDAVDATEENYAAVQEGLYTYYKGDPLKNPNRVLRAPGFYHWKKKPFLVETIHEESVKYSENLMMLLYPAPEKEEVEVNVESSWTSDFWRSVGEFDATKGLVLLSGRKCVREEIFDFRENDNGTKQILVNGKATGSWIDENGRIGSYSGGGPTLIQWLRYYNHDWRTIARIAREVLGIE